MGMTGRQRFWRVELPLALPLLLSGVRTGAVSLVGLATLSSLVALLERAPGARPRAGPALKRQDGLE